VSHLTDAERSLLERGDSRLRWYSDDMAYKAPEVLGDAGVAFQRSIDWQITVIQNAIIVENVRPLGLLLAASVLQEPLTGSSAFTIDRETGAWSPFNEPRTLEHRQALTIAASVLPGMTEDELDRLYDEIMSHDDPENPGRLVWVPDDGEGAHALRRFEGIPADALVPVAGQHPTLTALQASAADVPELVARMRVLEAQVASLRAGGSVAP